MRSSAVLSLAAASSLFMFAGCGEGLDAAGPEGEIDPPASASVGPTNYKGLALDGRAHIKPWRDPRERASLINTAVTANLKYYGGHVISNVNVIAVFWGPNVDATIKSGIGGFYSAAVNSAYIDWLSEYNTNITPVGGGSGTNQTIGRGTFGGVKTITPSITGTSVTDAQIQAELSKQITSGALPAPDANTLFMIHFPKGVSINQGGANSCQAGGFCAYHGTMTVGGANRYYGVMPDFSAGSGCDTGCGALGVFNNTTVTAAHELIEAITDAEVGKATSYGPPLAWYDQAGGEIGDICAGASDSGLLPGTSYYVQTEWSNKANACIITAGASNPTPSVSLTAPTAGATLAGTATISASASETGGTIASVAFYADGALLATDTTAPFSYAWSTTSVADGSHTLSAVATDAAGQKATSAGVAVTVKNTTGGGGATETESNNAFTSANALTSGVATTGTMSSASDVDYFKISLPAGKTLKVTLAVPASADYDLYAYNSNQTLVGSSTNNTGIAESVTISNTGTSAFTRYLKVKYYSGATAVNYTLTATLQ